ncbi:MAG: glutaredoxin family protein [Propionivibrio sp.]
MESALRPMAAELGFDLKVIDVDDRPDLLALYDELVPVLLHDATELCHYHLDVAKVRDYLNEIG